MNSHTKKLALIILDGWGIGNHDNTNAIHQANTPFFNHLLATYPHATLLTSGEHVGLPDGQMGNSEVGHLNIGAGRIVYQDLVKINKAILEKTIDQNEALLNAFRYAKENHKPVHLMGLVSDGGVHSSQEHLHYLCDLCKIHGLEDVFIHAFTDGRDTDPQSGLGFIQALENHLKNSAGKLATIIGRYYAMDRDKRWERVKVAYDALLKGDCATSQNLIEAIKSSYTEGITDEFIKPVVLAENELPVGRIKPNDVVICFNFRTDRCREITVALTQKDMPEHDMKTIPLHYVTMTKYDDTYKDVHVMYEKDNLNDTLGEVIAKAGKTQVRIAETEKYPHVTFFFSGGREKEFPGERRIMINSPKVATYDLQPEMSAREVTAAICDDISVNAPDFICLNFANPDMVGHTGVFSAVIKALETVDGCLNEVVSRGMKNGYSFIIIADHGNADFMINPDGSPNTAHTTNPVPVIVIDPAVRTVKDGVLADVAPSALDILKIDKPMAMKGNSLLL